jgi:hypothetical protein
MPASVDAAYVDAACVCVGGCGRGLCVYAGESRESRERGRSELLGSDIRWWGSLALNHVCVSLYMYS